VCPSLTFSELLLAGFVLADQPAYFGNIARNCGTAQRHDHHTSCPAATEVVSYTTFPIAAVINQNS
jgi:hypothetical protein